MELPPKDVLSSGSESTAFLLLAWQEMFDPYVPDTFQPRLFNIPLLVAELGLISEKAVASDRWQPHVKAIQDELACAVEWDQAFLAQLPYFRWASATISKKTSISEIAESAKTLNIYAAAFDQLVREQLRSTVANLPQHKEAAFRALRRLATIVVNAGFQQEDFKDLCGNGWFTRPPAEWIDSLISLTDLSGRQTERTYRCKFAVEADPKLLKRVAHKLRFRVERPENVDAALRKIAPHASLFQ